MVQKPIKIIICIPFKITYFSKHESKSLLTWNYWKYSYLCCQFLFQKYQIFQIPATTIFFFFFFRLNRTPCYNKNNLSHLVCRFALLVLLPSTYADNNLFVHKFCFIIDEVKTWHEWLWRRTATDNRVLLNRAVGKSINRVVISIS